MPLLESFDGCAQYVNTVTKKTPNKFAYVCHDEAARKQTVATHAASFGESIMTSEHLPFKYLVKIVGLPPYSPEEAIDLIIKCNPYLINNLTLHRSYYITNAGGQYLNIIAETGRYKDKSYLRRNCWLGSNRTGYSYRVDLLQCW